MAVLPEVHNYPLIYHKEYLLTHDFRSTSCILPGIDTNTYHLSRYYRLVTIAITLSGLIQIFESKMQDFFQTFSKRIISFSRIGDIWRP